jgi:pilus assembly protein CpaE
MRSGIHEFVHFPPDARDLTAAVDRLLQRSQTAAAQGLTVAVYSAKGGLGTTSVAINLAYGFARNDPKSRVALVDFVVAGGDVAVMLDLHPPTTSPTSRSAPTRSTPSSQVDAHAARAACGCCRRGTSRGLGSRGRVGGEHDHRAARRELRLHRDRLRALPHRPDPGGARRRDRVVLVTQLSIAALRSTQRTIQLCRRLGYPDDRLYVVANRYQSADVVSTEDAAQVLERQVYYKIPNDYRTSVAALTKGQAVSQYDVKSTLAVSYAGLAAKLAGGTSAASDANGTDTTSRLGRLLGRGRK